MKNKISTGEIITWSVVSIALLFGLLVEVSRGAEPRVQTVRQGGTGTSTFSADSIIVSGATATSSLSASSSPQVGFINATTTNATSTFAGGMTIGNALHIASTTATSTNASGWEITSGCFSINGECVGGGAATYVSLTDTQASLAANRIIFTNSGGSALTDNLLFVFDGVNFGIGTTSPYAQLTVGGSAVGTTLLGLDALSGQTAPIFDVRLASTTQFLPVLIPEYF